MLSKNKMCSCCGSPLTDGEYMILGNGITICTSCQDIIVEGRAALTENTRSNELTEDVLEFKPSRIKSILDEYVVGQEKAKKILSVSVYNHYKRLALQDKNIRKSNILLVGPTGSGKTHMIQVLAETLNVPLVIADATTMTEAGYIGDDVECVLEKLLLKCDGNVSIAEKGIIYIDEIDKISSIVSDTERKVGKKGVQQALLKLLEGTVVEVPVGNTDFTGAAGKMKVTIDTSQILFICGGAFPEMEEIIKKRIDKKQRLGFTNNIEPEMPEETFYKDNPMLQVTEEDLREFGMIPEFLGRLPVIAPLEHLTVETLKMILTEPKNSLYEQYKKMFSFDGIEFSMQEDALWEVAKRAYEKKTGARSLRAIMEEILMDSMFQAPDMEKGSQIFITRNDILSKTIKNSVRNEELAKKAIGGI